MAEKDEKVARKDFQDVVDVFNDQDEIYRVIALIERGHQIRRYLGSERDSKTGKPVKGDANYGLLAEYDDIKSELIMIQEAHDLPGLRFGRLGVQSQSREGRWFLSKKKLLEAGVDPRIIQGSYEQGESYYQTTLFELK